MKLLGELLCLIGIHNYTKVRRFNGKPEYICTRCYKVKG